METNETILFTNSFGTVSDKRVILNLKNGAEDLPLKSLTSVAFERKKNVPVGIVYFAVGVLIMYNLASMHNVPGYVMIIGMVFFLILAAIGTAYLLGSYRIKLTVSGVARPPIKIEMAKTREGREFADAIRKQLIAG